MLEIKDLHASINGKEILKGINMQLWDRTVPVRVHFLLSL